MRTVGMLMFFALGLTLLIARGGLPPPEEFLCLDRKDILRLALVLTMVLLGLSIQFVR